MSDQKTAQAQPVAITLEQYEHTFPNMDYQIDQWPAGDYRRLSPVKIKFFVPNRHCAWRVESLNTKEPDTIAWLAGMKPGEVLFDVGANIGQYSLIAAARGLQVHAFEPEAANFYVLCRNVDINRMSGRVTPWPLCLSDVQKVDTFFAQSVTPGGSCNSFGEPVNFHLKPKAYPVRQGSMSMRMLDFARDVAIPNHVKIDVDGLEHKVVAGMLNLLGTNALKSVLVEINTALPEHLAIIDHMKENGFEPDLETADQARRTEGAFAGIGNVIFYRKGYEHGKL